MTRPYLSHLTPHVRDPVSVIQPNPLLSTHIARGWVVRAGVDIRAGRQQDLRHLRMPTDGRHVKWGDLVLRGDRSGKEDMDKEKNEREKGYGCCSRD